MHGRDVEIHTNFWLENQKGRGLLGNLDVDGRIIIKLFL
jgi:hypothetical protein